MTVTSIESRPFAPPDEEFEDPSMLEGGEFNEPRGEVAKHLAALSLGTEVSVDQAQTEAEQARAVVRVALERSAPELLEGRLPPELAERVGPNYILGSNQAGVYDVQEAQESLDTFSGIDPTGPDGSESVLSQRFQFMDQFEPGEYNPFAEQAVLDGYYGPQSGVRFVVAVPRRLEGVSVGAAPDQMLNGGLLPPDFVIENNRPGMQPDHGTAVNAKYVAGVVDLQGNFLQNPSFMLSPEAHLGQQQ
jgi:hypothetical protein